MRHFGPDARDVAYLASTAALPWDYVWTQGGRITGGRSPLAGVYEVSQITFGRDALLWIGADAADVRSRPPSDEVFFMVVQRDERYGDPTSEARWRPRRAKLTDTPPDLDLDSFVIPPRRYELLTLHVDVGTADEPETVAVDNGLLVTAPDGTRLLFYCDDAVPLDMFVTTRPDRVDEYLARVAASRRVRG